MDIVTLLAKIPAPRPVHGQFYHELVNTVRIGNLPLVRRILL